MPGWTSNIIPDDDDLPEDASALPVVLIDGHYIIFRSFYAMPSLTAPDGTPVGALVGFCNVINKLVGQPTPQAAVGIQTSLLSYKNNREYRKLFLFK